MSKKIALVNKKSKLVENIIVPWECPEGYEAIETTDAQIGWMKNAAGQLVKTKEQEDAEAAEEAAAIEQFESRKKAAEAAVEKEKAKKQKLKDIKSLKKQLDDGKDVDVNAVLTSVIDIVLDD